MKQADKIKFLETMQTEVEAHELHHQQRMVPWSTMPTSAKAMTLNWSF